MKGRRLLLLLLSRICVEIEIYASPNQENFKTRKLPARRARDVSDAAVDSCLAAALVAGFRILPSTLAAVASIRSALHQRRPAAVVGPVVNPFECARWQYRFAAATATAVAACSGALAAAAAAAAVQVTADVTVAAHAAPLVLSSAKVTDVVQQQHRS